MSTFHHNGSDYALSRQWGQPPPIDCPLHPETAERQRTHGVGQRAGVASVSRAGTTGEVYDDATCHCHWPSRRDVEWTRKSEQELQIAESLLQKAEVAEAELQHAAKVQDYFLEGVATNFQKKIEADRWAFIAEYLAQKQQQSKLRCLLDRDELTGEGRSHWLYHSQADLPAPKEEHLPFFEPAPRKPQLRQRETQSFMIRPRECDEDYKLKRGVSRPYKSHAYLVGGHDGFKRQNAYYRARLNDLRAQQFRDHPKSCNMGRYGKMDTHSSRGNSRGLYDRENVTGNEFMNFHDRRRYQHCSEMPQTAHRHGHNAKSRRDMRTRVSFMETGDDWKCRRYVGGRMKKFACKLCPHFQKRRKSRHVFNDDSDYATSSSESFDESVGRPRKEFRHEFCTKNPVHTPHTHRYTQRPPSCYHDVVDCKRKHHEHCSVDHKWKQFDDDRGDVTQCHRFELSCCRCSDPTTYFCPEPQPCEVSSCDSCEKDGVTKQPMPVSAHKGGKERDKRRSLFTLLNPSKSCGSLQDMQRGPRDDDLEVCGIEQTSLTKPPSSGRMKLFQHHNRNASGGGERAGPEEEEEEQEEEEQDAEEDEVPASERQRRLLALIEARDVVVMEAAAITAVGGQEDELRRRLSTINAINKEIRSVL